VAAIRQKKRVNACIHIDLGIELKIIQYSLKLTRNDLARE
jgi:hypothetical protein